LPRGCLEDVVDLLESHGIQIKIRDERLAGFRLKVHFRGELRQEQKKAAEAVLAHENGVLSAATAFGKTVVAAYLIAKRSVNTLVLVHRKQLLEQWIERLKTFIDISDNAIGQIGGGKRKPTGLIDVAMIQSLSRKGVVDNIVAEYGHLVVDECHHVSARSFEIVARQSKAKFVTGLSATVIRKDGHHPIIFMKGGMGKKRRREALNAIENISDGEEKVILATGRYLGEGFDEQRLDTLFLTLPISWRGTLSQYAGRLHRTHRMKNEVVIYDYADLEVPMLSRMYERRVRGYQAIGYKIIK